jgi:CBS domain-containing protein
MSTVDLSDEVVREFVAEFGEDAPQVAERALRGEITRHRIERAVKDGTDPATAVAEALAKDPEFVAEVERLDAAGGQPAGDLEKRLRRSAG